jgi:DNA-binding NtrC family response regulator
MQFDRPGIMGQIHRFSKRILRIVLAQEAANQKILIVSEETDDAMAQLCRRLKMELNYAASLPLALTNLHDGKFDVVLYDQDIPRQDWRSALSALAEASPGSSILLLSTLKQPELWHEVIRRGGHDIVAKPVSDDGAESTIALALARARLSGKQSRRKAQSS